MIDRLDIHAFADRELPPEELARIEKEIAASPEAQRELEAIRSLKSCLSTRMTAPEAAGVWRACRGRLDELDKVKKTEFIVGKYAWALSALLFCVILSGGLYNHFRGGSVSVGQLASDIGGMTPMPLNNQPQVLQQFAAPTLHIDWSQVLGAAYRNTPEGRIYRFRMQDQKGAFDVVTIPNVSSVEGVQPIDDNMYAGQINGHNCVVRFDSGTLVLVIADRSTSDLRDLTESLYR